MENKQREEKRNEERKRLLAISDFDAGKLPVPERYQRMRYQGEIEAAKWLEEEKHKLAVHKMPMRKGRIVYD